MADWKWANTWGILRHGEPDNSDAVFHAGRLVDALRLTSAVGTPLLVASDSSGVWLASESGGPAIPLSWNWESPGLECLAQGPFGAQHVYAGGASLHETDVTQPAPLFSWREIPAVDANRRPIGEIHRILVVNPPRIIVLACDTGVFWARIPAPGGPYIFKPASGPPGFGGRFSGLAEGPEPFVVAGAWGTDLAAHFGIFRGNWSMGGLDFTPSIILPAGTAKQMMRTEITSFPGDRHRMYAVCGGGGGLTPVTDPDPKTKVPVIRKDGFGNVVMQGDGLKQGDDLIFRVLQSVDGGLSWGPMGNTILGQKDPLFSDTKHTDLAGSTQQGANICIGVSPVHRDLVAVGLRKFFIKNGPEWQLFQRADVVSLHEDVHALFFDPADPKGIRLHVCSDGGIATTSDLGLSWTTQVNRQLPNLEFGPDDGFLGNYSTVSPHDSGVIAGSLQDNGNVYASLYINPVPWTPADDGDGVLSVLIGNGDLIRENNGEDQTVGGVKVAVGRAARAAKWAPVAAPPMPWDPPKMQFTDLQLFPALPPLSWVIPLDGSSGGLTGGDTDTDPIRGNVMDPVRSPVFRNNDGELMLAVAAAGEAVFGLFEQAGDKLHWQQLGSIPHKPDIGPDGKEKPYAATGIGSLDGTAIYVGTTNGKVFRLDAPGWTTIDISDPVMKSLPVAAFAIPVPGWVYAIAGTGVFFYQVPGWVHLTGKVLPGGTDLRLPLGETFVGIQVDPSSAPAPVYVATGSGVFKSEDAGETWNKFSSGLPAAPQCRDLRIAKEASGVTFLYVSTFGWSLLRQPLGWDEFTKPVRVDGHMDIVNRKAAGHDEWTHPPITDARAVGPLHPVEEVIFAEDGNPEVRVVLKLHYQWNTDLTLALTYDAWLYDKDADEVDAYLNNSVNIALGTVEHVVVDMSSGEIFPDAPDEAHIEFDVTYG